MVEDTVDNFFDIKHFIERCFKYKQEIKAVTVQDKEV